MATKKGFRLELSKEVLDVKVLVVEGINCMSALRPTGGRWILELEELEIASDGDVDVFAFVEGMPKTMCAMKIKIDGKKEKEFNDNEFDKKRGTAFFNEEIALKDLTDE